MPLCEVCGEWMGPKDTPAPEEEATVPAAGISPAAPEVLPVAQEPAGASVALPPEPESPPVAKVAASKVTVKKAAKTK